MKYVITDQDAFALGNGGFHKELASGLPGTVIAAGLCEIADGRVHVSGMSTGYGIHAKPEDAARLERLLGLR